MSLGDRLREMLDPGASAPSSGPSGPSRRRPRGAQAQPLNPTRSFDSDAPKPMARAQWIAIGLVAAAAVALTAALVFAILTITRPGDQRSPTPTAAAAGSPTPPPPISSIFATPTPAGQLPATPTLPAPGSPGQRVQVGNTGGDGANLRREPGSAGGRLKTIPDGTLLQIVGPDSQADGQTWRNVRDPQGDSGWIVASFLVPEGSVPPPVASAPGSGSSSSDGTTAATAAPAAPRPTSATTTGPASRGQVGNTGGQGANIRSEPGANGRVLKTLAEGTTVDVLGPEREVDGRVWRQVRDSSGVTGWLVGGAVVPPGSVATPVPPVINPAATPKPSGATAAPGAGPTSAPAPAATPKPGGGSNPPSGGPTSTPSGNLPIIIQPATPLPKPGGSPSTGR